MISKGLRQALHQYVATESWDPKAFIISVSPPPQNVHGGHAGMSRGASSCLAAPS
jgi:uncharacterized protein YebE (UPF0316 family)